MSGKFYKYIYETKNKFIVLFCSTNDNTTHFINLEKYYVDTLFI